MLVWEDDTRSTSAAPSSPKPSSPRDARAVPASPLSTPLAAPVSAVITAPSAAAPVARSEADTRRVNVA